MSCTGLILVGDEKSYQAAFIIVLHRFRPFRALACLTTCVPEGYASDDECFVPPGLILMTHLFNSVGIKGENAKGKSERKFIVENK
jgi:hypothetical protein